MYRDNGKRNHGSEITKRVGRKSDLKKRKKKETKLNKMNRRTM